MSCFIEVLKCILCMDDDDRPSRQILNAPQTRQSNSGVTNSSYNAVPYRHPLLYTTALDRDPEVYSKRISPETSQSKSSYSTGVYRDPLLYSTALDRDPQLYSKRNSPRTSQSNSEDPLLCITAREIAAEISQYKSSYSTGANRDPLLYSTALDRDPELYSKRNCPQTSQSNSEVTNSSFKTRNDSYPRIPSQYKSIYELNRVNSSATVQLATDEATKSKAGNAVSGKDTFKLSSIPKSLATQSPIKPPPIYTQPTIAVACSSSSVPQSKDAYVWVEKASTTYVFPKEIKCLIEKDIVPGVLKMPLSKSSYKDYFHALLYAEDCYLEKWDGFKMENVKVELREATIYTRGGKDRYLKKVEEKDKKFFVTFEVDKVRRRRPFLISRDFVSLQPTGQTVKPFQGVIYRMWNSNLVLAEFEEDFFSHHHPDDKYDAKFSFNRVCLKRAHQAIAAASDSLFNNLLFPNNTQKYVLSSQRYIHPKEPCPVGHILRLDGLPPYLVEGPLAVENDRFNLSKAGITRAVENDRFNLSKTGEIVVEAITRILRADPLKKILLCAPMNRTCDVLMRGLKNKKEIAESDLFRANAAFRELDGVPEDILPSCLYQYDKHYFSCPQLWKLNKYKVISTTFMSSYRLYGEGIEAGYFSHIFVVDASSATEPEALVPLANFVTAKTVVVVTGAPGNHSSWTRSQIARENGLMTSYFERLCDMVLED